MLETYRLVNRFRVPFADIDMLGHANNTAYLRWAEAIRTEYLSDVLGEFIGGARGMILGRITAVYESPVGYREAVAIGCRVERVGTKSFDFAHEVWSEDRAVRCTTIASTLVAMDYTTNATIAVPDDWRARIAAYERTA
ncbi:MAG: thioesterase family protein [Vulcanimicrobiaceae bacterium]